LESFGQISAQHLHKIIMASPTKSCRLDPIPTWLLKDPDVLQSLLPVVCASINASLDSGVVPLCVKNGIITPLLKKPGLDCDELINYRPVSNLPFLGKVMEKVVASQIIQHMDTHGLNNTYQSAYRAGHSTETALLKIKNDVDLALDQGDGVLMALLDLSAAFDTVDHAILLERLESRIGITGAALHWIKSYLSGRTQTVGIGNDLSDPVKVEIGVPQGSVLGPLFFLVYILPIADILRKHGILFHGYADDTQLYLRFNPKDPTSLLSAIARIEACLRELCQWMVQNKLKLNPDKTEFIIFVLAHLRSLVDLLQPTLRVGDAVVHPTKCVRNLGAHFDSEMSMLPHIKQTVRGAYGKIKSISRIRRYLDFNTCAKIVQALVVSKLDYTNSLLVGLPQCALRKLHVCQNSAARLVSRTPLMAHISPVLKRLHWLPVHLRIQYKLLSTAFKTLKTDTAPDYLKDLLHKNERRCLRSSSSVKLDVPRTKRKVGDRAFSVSAPRLWNALPADLRNSDSLNTFKRGLKTYYFTQHYVD
jgi:hypothetical protein